MAAGVAAAAPPSYSCIPYGESLLQLYDSAERAGGGAPRAARPRSSAPGRPSTPWRGDRTRVSLQLQSRLSIRDCSCKPPERSLPVRTAQPKRWKCSRFRQGCTHLFGAAATHQSWRFSCSSSSSTSLRPNTFSLTAAVGITHSTCSCKAVWLTGRADSPPGSGAGRTRPAA